MGNIIRNKHITNIMIHYTVEPKDKTRNLDFCENPSQTRIVKNVMYTPKPDKYQLLKSVFYDEDELMRELNHLINKNVLSKDEDNEYYYLTVSSVN